MGFAATAFICAILIHPEPIHGLLANVAADDPVTRSLHDPRERRSRHQMSSRASARDLGGWDATNAGMVQGTRAWVRSRTLHRLRVFRVPPTQIPRSRSG